MAHLGLVKVTIFVVVSAILGPRSYADLPGDPVAWIAQQPGYSVSLPMAFCESTFPHHKAIVRTVNVSGKKDSFTLFAFTARPFDPRKPSLVTIPGGPGAVSSRQSAEKAAGTFSEFNVVFFHYRGAGCSDFHHTSAEWDALLSSEEVIEDIEAIRRAYDLAKWTGVLAHSYGTNIARHYANRFADRAGLLILEGLDDRYVEVELSEEQQTQRIMSTIENRLRTSPVLYAKAADIDRFLDLLRTHFSQINVDRNFWYAAMWDSLKGSVPENISYFTVLSIAFLVYEGEGEEADNAILVLMNELGVLSLDIELKRAALTPLTKWEKQIFSFRSDDYRKNFTEISLLSWRVQLKMSANDARLPEESLCNSQPMIVLSGTKDLATPIENAETYLGNKDCARGENIGLTVVGGGHSNMGFVACLSAFVRKSLVSGRALKTAPEKCVMPVRLKVY